jgi:hypothetical protein
MAAAFVPADMTVKMAETVVNNERIAKVDCIARIDLYGFWHYSIFRRYNSPYDILVEDIHKNIVHLDMSSTATIRSVISKIRHISAHDVDAICITSNYSLEHSSSIIDIAHRALDMPLIEVQREYAALYLNLEGVPSSREDIALEGLISLSIPKTDPTEFYQSPSDANDLSLRVADVTLRVIGIMEEINELVDEISAHDEHCIVLRSGRRIHKI